MGKGAEGERLTSQRFGLTYTGHLLRRDIQGGARNFMLMNNEEARDAYRGTGLYSMKSGRSGFMELYGEGYFDWHARHSSNQKQFDGAMTDMTPMQVAPLLADWSPPSPNATVCDIAGGQGHLLASVLQHYPSLKGILVDQPTVVDRSLLYLSSRNVSHRASVVGGSIFEPLPTALAACDAFFLKMILH